MNIENENTELDDLQVEAEDDLEVVIDESDEEELEGAAPEADDADEDEESEPASEAEPEVEPEAEPEGEEDAELASMPSKFKKRLDREIRLRDQIRNERDQIKTAAVQVAQIAKQKDDEVLQLRKQNAALQRQFAETLDYAYERDISMKASELRKAREDGNYDDELKLQGELDQLRFQHNQVRQAKTTLPDPEKIVPTQSAPQAQQPAPQAQPQREPPAPQAIKWLESNKTWFANPKFAGHKAFALSTDMQLVAEGYDKHTADYYKELDRRIDEAFPTLRKKGKPTSSPVAPAVSSPARATSSRVIKLTKSDLTNMRMFGLDPSNKEHLREYARNKRAA